MCGNLLKVWTKSNALNRPCLFMHKFENYRGRAFSYRKKSIGQTYDQLQNMLLHYITGAKYAKRDTKWYVAQFWEEGGVTKQKRKLFLLLKKKKERIWSHFHFNAGTRFAENRHCSRAGSFSSFINFEHCTRLSQIANKCHYAWGANIIFYLENKYIWLEKQKKTKKIIQTIKGWFYTVVYI